MNIIRRVIRNLMHRKDVSINCDIINNFEEKIQVFKSVKNYASIFIELLDEPYTNHLFFKIIKRKYNFDKPEMCSNINLRLVISMDKKRTINLILSTSDNYNDNYNECINIQITDNCKLKSFKTAKHDLNLIPTMFDMMLVEYNRIYEIGLARKSSYRLIEYSKYKQECI